MQIKVNYLENLKLEALFDDYRVISDQPIRYKGDATAPGPFDYFLASSAMCAAYFVLVYCKARGIETTDISISQNNIQDPENRYQQKIEITLQIPDSISQKDREGMIASIDRCTVKRVVQNSPEFILKAQTTLKKSQSAAFDEFLGLKTKTLIKGKDSSLEDSIRKLSQKISDLGINLEISSWRNPLPHVWSVHIRDADSPMCYTNGKGSTKEAALCSALGEFLERLSTNYFYADYFLGIEFLQNGFLHYPNEKWFDLSSNERFPQGLLDEHLKKIYDLDGELSAHHLLDSQANQTDKICALPYTKVSTGKTVYIPTNLIGNLFVSNGMSAGNNLTEAKVQALSEIFERAVKERVITGELALPCVPSEILKKYPSINEGIQSLKDKGYPILIKDASLGGRYPVLNITLMNPKTGGVFSSFGSHPKFEVALERCLTELMQGRSFEGLNDFPPPSFSPHAVKEHNNIVEHFIDSNGMLSWLFFSNKSDYDFNEWNFEGSTDDEFQYLIDILKREEKEVYIAEYIDLGVAACRVLVPDFSEIYQADDLIWDNNNRALQFRSQILNLHKLDKKDMKSLVVDLEESGIDNFMPTSELIGVLFDESDPWGQSVIGEIKGFLYLAIGNLEEASTYFSELNTFSDGTIERKLFYQVVDQRISLALREGCHWDDFKESFYNLYGEELSKDVDELVSGRSRFYGLYPTDENFLHNPKHQRLIESYRKLHQHRSANE
ncbi:MAG: OsmC domain/YcaO domain-containing protein [Halobacteriovoraceae bacterium]|nr:OsmC domain/YcaO domain-containing protein [Halobacteriovoraceae bacterium]|tara:strand:- start:1144 stop:3321 length:2178 start_codon:yes stop_codon:yes gene_type:complete